MKGSKLAIILLLLLLLELIYPKIYIFCSVLSLFSLFFFLLLFFILFFLCGIVVVMVVMMVINDDDGSVGVILFFFVNISGDLGERIYNEKRNKKSLLIKKTY